ncbi:MAG: hypothetical protein V4582_20655 [Pseudomonadota bacterium]
MQSTQIILDNKNSPLDHDLKKIDMPMPSALTYERLLSHGCDVLSRQDMGSQQIKNLASALRLWIRTHGFANARAINEDFGKDFDNLFSRFCDNISDTLAHRTQGDRQEQILRWRRIAEAIRRHDVLPDTFGEALRFCITSSSMSETAVARSVGLTPTALRHWMLRDGMPTSRTLDNVLRLEELFKLPKGTLIGRIPQARRAWYARGLGKISTSTSFTKIRQQQTAATSNYTPKFQGRIAEQWDSLIRFKTDQMRDHSRARSTWRTKPIDRVSQRVHPSSIIDGRVCATASVNWGMIASFLGWLSLDKAGGPRIPAEEATTLAWLCHKDYVIQYAKWAMRRSGGKFHNGVSVFIQVIESYLRPHSGFLWLNEAIGDTLPEGVLRRLMGTQSESELETWQAFCAKTRRELREFRERAADTYGIRLSRDPSERITTVLNDEFPLRKLVEFVESVERNMPPPAHQRDYRAWLRDVVLCRLLLTNPLRIGQIAAMTFRFDGTGNLIRMGAGRYRIKFEPEDFKNEKGAANKPYNVEVEPTLGEWIDRYLNESRPYLVGADESDRLLLATTKGPRKENIHLTAAGMVADIAPKAEAFYSRVRTLTSTYIDGCPGFGPQCFRHVIATDHLRRHPGDYLTVATLLHDKLETVLKNYSHLKVQDGLRVLATGVQQASADLAARRSVQSRAK